MRRILPKNNPKLISFLRYCSSGINYQSIAKIALHTTEGCTMYNQVPEYVKNGTWEWSSK